MQKTVKESFDLAIGRILMVMENCISVLTVIVLLFMLLFEMLNIFADPLAYLTGPDAVTNYLHEVLTIVVGLEFVKLLMHLTPANVVEVLVMAISRSIIVSHGNAIDNLLGILCIVLLFGTRRLLITRQEMHHSMDEDTDETACTPCQQTAEALNAAAQKLKGAPKQKD